MRVKMSPRDPTQMGVGGIATVLAKYHQHLPELGVTIAGEGEPYDVEVVHAGVTDFRSPRGANVAMLHGLYWTGDTPRMGHEYYAVNRRIARSIMQASVVTVPSQWVADSIAREFHLTARIVPHGVDVDEWQGGDDKDYVLWAKNHPRYDCDPAPVNRAAQLLPDVRFLSTFGMDMPNLKTAKRPFSTAEMRDAILNCSVYLATTRETFGIATLEAMAAGKPVVGYNVGFQPVLHGITGYLARSGDTDDLARGIRWALEHRDVLGANSRIVAGWYTWKRACESFIEACLAAEDAAKREHGGITIVIPYRNKGEVLREAIDSALNQTTSEPVRVIVVDDASDDDTASVIAAECSKKRVRVIRLNERGGVAQARNAGIAAANTEYIVCLDADDALAPAFVERCYRRIAHDRKTGIVYTGLGNMQPDGSIVKSAWPGVFNFWGQAAGQNQVPTACMFRKEMWRRVGGFRPRYTRYARLGYGSEDAAFWLHGTAIGYEAVQVTPEPLFLYRPGGSTSRAGYREVPWHNFFKWEERGYPPGAPTKQGQTSWQVHTYQPHVSVIIPVGQGHAVYLADALDSIEAQTYRKTETIVVWDSAEPIPAWYKSGYPWVKFLRTPQPGSGAGAARNIGARAARTPFVIFLDADDMLVSTFVSATIAAWQKHHAIIYTDYIGEEDIMPDSDPRRRPGYIGQDDLGGVFYTNNRLLDFDRQRAIAQPEADIYVWCTVSCLLPRSWFLSVGGFNESLESWEDWDLHIRLARAGYNYHHLNEYLLHYRKGKGGRAEKAAQNWSDWALPDRVGQPIEQHHVLR